MTADEPRSPERPYRHDDTRPIPVVDEDGNPMSLEDALAMRDRLVERASGATADVRRDDVNAIDAAKRLGRLQAQLALHDRRRP